MCVQFVDVSLLGSTICGLPLELLAVYVIEISEDGKDVNIKSRHESNLWHSDEVDAPRAHRRKRFDLRFHAHEDLEELGGSTAPGGTDVPVESKWRRS
jgi:hypothetical protein